MTLFGAIAVAVAVFAIVVPGPARGTIPGYQRVDGTASDKTSQNVKIVTAQCPTGAGGKLVLSGGFLLLSSGGNVVVTENRAIDANTWQVRAAETSRTSKKWSIQAFAVCASPDEAPAPTATPTPTPTPTPTLAP